MWTRSKSRKMDQQPISDTITSVNEEPEEKTHREQKEGDQQRSKKLEAENERRWTMMEEILWTIKREIARIPQEINELRQQLSENTSYIHQRIDEVKRELENEIETRFQSIKNGNNPEQGNSNRLEKTEMHQQMTEAEHEYVQDQVKEKGEDAEITEHHSIKNDRHEKEKGQLYPDNINQFLKIKIFEGQTGEAPMEHIKSLEKYFQVNQINDFSKLAIACSHLHGDAQAWWESLFHYPVTFEEYKKELLKSFWNEQHQEMMLYQAMQEKHDENNGENYLQFFRRQVATLRTLNACHISEGQIVRIIRRNLPLGIEQMLLTANMNTVQQMAELLSAVDMTQRDTQGTKDRQKQNHWHRKAIPRNNSIERRTHQTENNGYNQGKRYWKEKQFRPPSPRPGCSKDDN